MTVTLTPITTTVTVTVGTNSYASVATADAFLATDYALATAWDALTADEKARALVTATRHIDGLRLIGYKAVDTQALAFPRTFATPYHCPTCDDDYTVQATVPQAVIDATCMEAASLISDGRDALRADGVSEYTIGSLHEKLSGGARALRSKDALRLLKPYVMVAVPIR
jgi:hypothetical protein